MRFGSVCSGIEAASVAWEPIGWKAAWFAEIEPFPCAVLKHHYPDTPNLGDMNLWKEWPDAAIDVLCGGTPCQSFSVAGLRKGLDDPRGNLMLTFLAIAKRHRPRWLVWENVPGVLSSNGGRDFGSFLGGLAECGYGFAYRVLDAQYFGLAQRRKRVFVVAYLGNWRPAAAVLFERESLCGHPAPRREAGKVAPTIPARSLAGGGLGTDFDCDGGIVQVCPTLRAGGNSTGGDRPPGTDVDTVESLQVVGIPDPAYAITGGPDGRQFGTGRDSQDTFVTHSLRGEGFDASEDGTGRGTPLVPVGVTLHGTDGTQSVASFTDLSSSLRSRIPSGVENSTTTAVMQPVTYDLFNVTAPVNRQNRQPGDPCHTLARANAEHAAVVQATAWSIMPQNSGRDYKARQVEVLQPLMAAGPQHGNQGGDLIMQPVAFHENQRAEVTVNDTAGSLKVGGGKPGQGYPALLTAMQVRRLTPVECERLQGFPDGYTAIPWRGKQADQCPDGPRYKALGNSWAVPVVRWIGERINLVDSVLEQQAVAA